MPVSTVITSFSYKPGAAMLPEAIRFQYMDAADVSVTHVSAVTGIRLPLSRDVAFSISGDGISKTGRITALQVWPANDEFFVERRTDTVQKANIKPFEPVPALALTSQLDRGIMGVQEAQATADDTQSRALMVPPGETAPDLPRRALRIGGRKKIIAINQDTGAFEVEPIDETYVGGTGPANSTYPSIAAIAAADIANKSAILAPTEGSGLTGATYTWKNGDYTGRNDVIASDYYPIAQGAWVLPDTGSVTFRGIGSDVTQLLDARAKRDMWITDFLPSGFVTTAGQDYSAAIQEGIDKAVQYDIPLKWIGGIFDVSGAGVIARPGLKLRGAGRERTFIRNVNGTVIRMNGGEYDFEDLFLFSVGGGHTVRQTGSVGRSAFRRVGIWQASDNYSLWDNQTFPYIKVEFDDFYFQHTETATVHGFNLVSVGGDINDNIWHRGWGQYSGNYMWNVEATGANAQYANEWTGNTLEVMSGGAIRQIAAKNFVISKNRNWDVDDSTRPVKKVMRDYYVIDRNSLGQTCSGDIIRNTRLAGQNAPGVVDVRLASGGASADITLFGNATVGGGDPFLIDAANNYIFAVAPNTVCQVLNAGNATIFDPLSGAGSVPQGYEVNGQRVVGQKVAGLSPISGSASGAGIATYNAPTIGGSYSQAQVQSLADAAQQTSQRMKAIDDALRAHGLIGP